MRRKPIGKLLVFRFELLELLLRVKDDLEQDFGIVSRRSRYVVLGVHIETGGPDSVLDHLVDGVCQRAG